MLCVRALRRRAAWGVAGGAGERRGALAALAAGSGLAAAVAKLAAAATACSE